MSFYTDPAWWALAVAGASAVFTGFAARSAAHNARITKADALVCKVDLRLQFGDHDARLQKGGMRQISVVNHGMEVAFGVALDPEATEIKVEEYSPGDLGWNERTNVSFFEPDGDDPHYFVFTFRRPWELGGEEKTVSLKYDREALC